MEQIAQVKHSSLHSTLCVCRYSRWLCGWVSVCSTTVCVWLAVGVGGSACIVWWRKSVCVCDYCTSAGWTARYTNRLWFWMAAWQRASMGDFCAEKLELRIIACNPPPPKKNPKKNQKPKTKQKSNDMISKSSGVEECFPLKNPTPESVFISPPFFDKWRPLKGELRNWEKSWGGRKLFHWNNKAM